MLAAKTISAAAASIRTVSHSGRYEVHTRSPRKYQSSVDTVGASISSARCGLASSSRQSLTTPTWMSNLRDVHRRQTPPATRPFTLKSIVRPRFASQHLALRCREVSKRAFQLALVSMGFHHITKRGGRRCFRGECVSRTASYHSAQGCKVNMQLGGATSRDLARQADQYGLFLALLHQGATDYCICLPSLRTFALRLASEGAY
jgi:hypothetical protein